MSEAPSLRHEEMLRLCRRVTGGFPTFSVGWHRWWLQDTLPYTWRTCLRFGPQPECRLGTVTVSWRAPNRWRLESGSGHTREFRGILEDALQVFRLAELVIDELAYLAWLEATP